MMSPNTAHSSEEKNEEEEKGGEDRWRWKKVVVLEETKKQVLYALPMIITNVSYYLIPVVAVMFAGHLGDLELAASNLAISWATVTGFDFMVGQSGALETLCGQGYGAKLYRMMGLYLQASCIISVFFSVLISISWLYSESILILFHQDRQVSKCAALYVRYLIPGLFAYGLLQNILRFLQTQSAVVPLLFCSLMSDQDRYITLLGKLMNFAFVLLAGLMPLSRITTSLIAMCVNTATIAFMITYGLSAAASTRVSNELGAGNPDRAKHAIGVTLTISLFLALTIALALALGHNIWAGFFRDSSTIIKKFASLSHFLVISIVLDSIQGVLSGVARGCGWQHSVVFINLGAFYCIGMPISIFLGFKRKLYAEGLWLGIINGLSCQVISLLLLILCSKWTPIELSKNNNNESLV